MDKKIILLSGLLLAQIILAALLVSRPGILTNAEGMQPLVDFQPEAVDQIIISDGTQEIKLLKKEGQWTTAAGFPVESGRPGRLLTQVKELQHGLPIGSSAATQKRFRVTGDDYERQLRLEGGGRLLAKLTLGSGAGARRSYVRAGGADDVFPVTLGSFDLPVDIATWQDKTVLQFKMDSLETVQTGALMFRKTQAPDGTDGDAAAAVSDATAKDEADADAGTAAVATWDASPLGEAETFDAEAFQGDMRQLANLRYQQAYPEAKLAELAPGSTLQTQLQLSFNDGTSRSYDFYQSQEDESFYLQVSDQASIFKINSALGRRFKTGSPLKKWLKTKEVS